MTNTFAIQPISAFSDNYIWCISVDGRAAVVDPGDATPVVEFLNNNELELEAILITHHHFDHVGGIDALLAQWPQLKIFGPHNDCVNIQHRLKDGDRLHCLGLEFEVLAVPGHTLDHIAYYAQPGNLSPLLFCGDTLFAGGCGRIFEGSPAQMQHSLQSLAELPADTRVYCAHEYTLANLDFALAAEPGNRELCARRQREQLQRRADRPTLPSTIELERRTNPFLRTDSPELQSRVQAHAGLATTDELEIFTALRQWKNEF